MNKIVVKILESESRDVEFLFHKYNSLMAVLGYLYENGKASEEYLDKKLDELTYLNIDLEKMKKHYGMSYKPEQISDNFNYTFNFDDHTIIYEEVNG